MSGNILDNNKYTTDKASISIHGWNGGKFFRKVLTFVFKSLVLVVSAWYLYAHVLINTEFRSILSQSLDILSHPVSIWLFSATIIMSIINWSLETQKWRFLLKRFTRISFGRAFSAILSGNA